MLGVGDCARVRSERGVGRLNDIKLLLGDCFDVFPTLTEQYGLWFSDPPWNQKKDYGAMTDDDLPIEQYTERMRRVVEWGRKHTDNRIALLVGSKLTHLFWDLLPEARHIVIKKGAIATPTPDMFYRQFASLLVTAKPYERCHDLWDGLRFPGEGYYFREPRYPHPGLTSLKMTKRVLRYFSKPGDTIVDLFAGTGTTAVACIEMSRNFVGCEINPEYFAIAQKRIADAQKQMTMDLTQ